MTLVSRTHLHSVFPYSPPRAAEPPLGSTRDVSVVLVSFSHQAARLRTCVVNVDLLIALRPGPPSE